MLGQCWLDVEPDSIPALSQHRVNASFQLGTCMFSTEWVSIIYVAFYTLSLQLTLVMLRCFFNYPLEVVSRYRDPQLQVAKNYSYLFDLSTIICKSWCLDTHFVPDISDLIDYQAELKTTIVVISEMRVNRFYMMWKHSVWHQNIFVTGFVVMHIICKCVTYDFSAHEFLTSSTFGTSRLGIILAIPIMKTRIIYFEFGYKSC